MGTIHTAIKIEAMGLSGLLIQKAEIEKAYMPAVCDEDIKELWAYLCPDEYIDILQDLGKRVANVVESYPAEVTDNILTNAFINAENYAEKYGEFILDIQDNE